MTSERKPLERFASAFAEELGKWAARVVIGIIIATASSYILLPS